MLLELIESGLFYFGVRFFYSLINREEKGGIKMAGYNPYATNSYQGTQMFPQPQGNVYTLNNSMEIANIPVSGGISVGICPSENLMYIKAMVNGAPSLMVYTITPCETKQNLQNDEVSSRLERLEGQIEEIKKLLGGEGKLKNEL